MIKRDNGTDAIVFIGAILIFIVFLGYFLFPATREIIPDDLRVLFVGLCAIAIFSAFCYAIARNKFYGKPLTPDMLKDRNYEMRYINNGSGNICPFYEIWLPGERDGFRIVADPINHFFYDIPKDIFPIYVWIGTKTIRTEQGNKIQIERFRTIELIWDELSDDLKTKKAVRRQYEVSVYEKGNEKKETEKAKA